MRDLARPSPGGRPIWEGLSRDRQDHQHRRRRQLHLHPAADRAGDHLDRLGGQGRQRQRHGDLHRGQSRRDPQSRHEPRPWRGVHIRQRPHHQHRHDPLDRHRQGVGRGRAWRRPDHQRFDQRRDGADRRRPLWRDDFLRRHGEQFRHDRGRGRNGRGRRGVGRGRHNHQRLVERPHRPDPGTLRRRGVRQGHQFRDHPGRHDSRRVGRASERRDPDRRGRRPDRGPQRPEAAGRHGHGVRPRRRRWRIH